MASLGAAPPHLHEAGRAAWAAAAAHAHVTELHRLQVTRLAELYDRRAALVAVLDSDGLVVAGSKGQPRPHPALVAAETTERAILATERALGLQPERGDSSGSDSMLGDFLSRQRGGRGGSDRKHTTKAS